MLAPAHALQTGFPEFLPQLLGLVGTLVLVLMLVAIAGIAYKHLTGGIEWPADRDEEDDDMVRQGGPDDEWEYY